MKPSPRLKSGQHVHRRWEPYRRLGWETHPKAVEIQGPALVWLNSGSLSRRCSRIKFPQCSQGQGGGRGPPVPDGATDRSLLAKRDDIGKKLIFLGSRNSRALKCRTQGKLCYLPQRPGFPAWGGGRRDHSPGVGCQDSQTRLRRRRALILSRPLSLVYGTRICPGQRQRAGNTLPPSVSWAGKLKARGLGDLSSGSRTPPTDSEPGLHVPLPCWSGWEKETSITAPAVCHHVAGHGHGHGAPPSGLLRTPFVRPLSAAPCCELRRVHARLAKQAAAVC